MGPESRYVEGVELADVVDVARNADVAAYLAEHRPSCHSDTGDALIRSAHGCGDWVAFSPSFGQCRYVALVTNRRVFGLGLGQNSVLYRLPEPFTPRLWPAAASRRRRSVAIGCASSCSAPIGPLRTSASGR